MMMMKESPRTLFKVQGSRFFICHLCLDQQSRHIGVIFVGLSESAEVQNKHIIIRRRRRRILNIKMYKYKYINI